MWKHNVSALKKDDELEMPSCSKKQRPLFFWTYWIEHLLSQVLARCYASLNHGRQFFSRKSYIVKINLVPLGS
jgi:hypothetical protein